MPPITRSVKIERYGLLLVEKENIIAFDIQRSLPKIGIKLTCVSSIEAASELIQKQKPDILMLDLNLLDNSFINCIKDIPVILTVSGSINENDTKDLNVIATFSKPFISNNIVEFIGRFLFGQNHINN